MILGDRTLDVTPPEGSSRPEGVNVGLQKDSRLQSSPEGFR